MNTEQNIYQPITRLATATAFLLLIPLIAMQFSSGVNWTLSDFIIAGILLFGTGFSYILITRILTTQTANNTIYRIAIGFSLFTGLFLIWVNMAVGIIGSEDNPANIMYLGVPAVGIVSAFIARFRPKGMMITMLGMALVQALLTAIVLAYGMYQTPPSTVFHILGVNGFFIMLFVVSAMLFRFVVKEEPSAEK